MPEFRRSQNHATVYHEEEEESPSSCCTLVRRLGVLMVLLWLVLELMEQGILPPVPLAWREGIPGMAIQYRHVLLALLAAAVFLSAGRATPWSQRLFPSLLMVILAFYLARQEFYRDHPDPVEISQRLTSLLHGMEHPTDQTGEPIQLLLQVVRHTVEPLHANRSQEDRDRLLRLVRQVEEAPDDPRRWNLLGEALRSAGINSDAERVFGQIQRIAAAHEDPAWSAIACGNLGALAYVRGDLRRAESFFRKSLEIDLLLDHKERVALAYGNLGHLALRRNDLEQAEQLHQESMAIETAMNNQRGIARQWGYLGMVQQKRGDPVQAEALFRKSMAIYEALGDKAGMAGTLWNFAHFHWQQKDAEQAEADLRQGMALLPDATVK